MDRELFGKGRRLHPIRAANEKRIARELSQSPQRVRYGRLTTVELNRSAQNTPMAPNGVEYDKQIEINFIIHQRNI